METSAKLRYVRISPTKARLVARAVRGRMVADVLAELKFTPKRAARILSKLLSSAVANATQNANLDVDTLYVKSIRVDEGPTLKRWRPRAMGRASRIFKRTSHITVVLDERAA
ncbi:MAG: 50S ribosomal protein L22 [Proteobacteria bacterium]|nr:50S ribosomal protein L22 [Pseudomonadota bacterium]MBU1741966.1 50S ribosomal protein L22 [Pseudomonadota bacterium]